MSESKAIHGFTVTRAEGLTDEQRENNRRWIKALRSGSYPQIKKRLRSTCGMCCLGVAEDVMGAEWVPDKELEDGSVAFLARHLGEKDATLSPSRFVGSAMGFGFSDGFRVDKADGQEARILLSDLNDSEGLNFDQIADVIAYWAGLEDGPETSGDDA